MTISRISLPGFLPILMVLGTLPLVAAPLPGGTGGAGGPLVSLGFAGGLFVGMLALMEWGRRLGTRRLLRDLEGARAGLGAVEGALFALLGLLIAFTFSGAAARFDGRRHLIVQEANHVGTAWLRLDVLPAAAQPGLRDLLREYVDSRLAAYRKLADFPAATAELDRSVELQSRIWKQAVAACETPEGQRALMLVLPALNAMFDIVTDRTTALQTHPPVIVFLMLGALALASALVAGFGMAGGKRRSWVHFLGYPLVMAGCVYVIMDLEFPRLGLIRIDGADQLLVDVRQAMD
jgi:hypothetical protein